MNMTFKNLETDDVLKDLQVKKDTDVYTFPNPHYEDTDIHSMTFHVHLTENRLLSELVRVIHKFEEYMHHSVRRDDLLLAVSPEMRHRLDYVFGAEARIRDNSAPNFSTMSLWGIPIRVDGWKQSCPNMVEIVYKNGRGLRNPEEMMNFVNNSIRENLSSNFSNNYLGEFPQ